MFARVHVAKPSRKSDQPVVATVDLFETQESKKRVAWITYTEEAKGPKRGTTLYGIRFSQAFYGKDAAKKEREAKTTQMIDSKARQCLEAFLIWRKQQDLTWPLHIDEESLLGTANKALKAQKAKEHKKAPVEQKARTGEGTRPEEKRLEEPSPAPSEWPLSSWVAHTPAEQGLPSQRRVQKQYPRALGRVHRNLDGTPSKCVSMKVVVYSFPDRLDAIGKHVFANLAVTNNYSLDAHGHDYVPMLRTHGISANTVVLPVAQRVPPDARLWIMLFTHLRSVSEEGKVPEDAKDMAIEKRENVGGQVMEPFAVGSVTFGDLCARITTLDSGYLLVHVPVHYIVSGEQYRAIKVSIDPTQLPVIDRSLSAAQLSAAELADKCDKFEAKLKELRYKLAKKGALFAGGSDARDYSELVFTRSGRIPMYSFFRQTWYTKLYDVDAFCAQSFHLACIRLGYGSEYVKKLEPLGYEMQKLAAFCLRMFPASISHSVDTYDDNASYPEACPDIAQAQADCEDLSELIGLIFRYFTENKSEVVKAVRELLKLYAPTHVVLTNKFRHQSKSLHAITVIAPRNGLNALVEGKVVKPTGLRSMMIDVFFNFHPFNDYSDYLEGVRKKEEFMKDLFDPLETIRHFEDTRTWMDVVSVYVPHPDYQAQYMPVTKDRFGFRVSEYMYALDHPEETNLFHLINLTNETESILSEKDQLQLHHEFANLNSIRMPSDTRRLLTPEIVNLYAKPSLTSGRHRVLLLNLQTYGMLPNEMGKLKRQAFVVSQFKGKSDFRLTDNGRTFVVCEGVEVCLFTIDNIALPPAYLADDEEETQLLKEASSR